VSRDPAQTHALRPRLLPATSADRSRATAVLGLVVAPLLALAPACQPPDAPGNRAAFATGVREREAPRVRTTTVERREMVEVLETTTVLESEAEIQVFPRVSGEVVEVLAEEGDSVDVDQVLARIDGRDERLAVADARVGLEEAQNTAEIRALAVQEARDNVEQSLLAYEQSERDYLRDLRLFEGQEVASALSEKALEASRLARDNAKYEHGMAELAWKRAQVEEKGARTAVSRAGVALERAELALSYTEIRAPFTGVVAERRTRVGDTVGPADAAFVLTDTANLRAVFFRPQRELSRFLDATREPAAAAGGAVARTLEVTATAEAIADAVFRGEIVRVSPTVDSESGSFRVTARLETGADAESGRRLLPGMLLRLRIVTDRHPDALVVPKRAVRREGEESFVLRVEDGIARRIAVTEAFADDDFVEVVPFEEDALADGDEIVEVGTRDLEDGAEVRVDDGGAATLPPAEEPTEEPTEGAAADGADADEASAGRAADSGTEGPGDEADGTTTDEP